jgi:F-type H+-transporting ATPase subunit b
MIFLAEFSVIKPDFGLFFWTLAIFLTLWFILGKLAFKPIAEALKKREHTIDEALKSAEKAREEMSKMKSENEALLVQAREERAGILKEAKEAKEMIINEAKSKAKEDASKIMTNAMSEIENQKQKALTELKNQSGILAIGIAEKILQKELSDKNSSDKYVADLLKDMNLN